MDDCPVDYLIVCSNGNGIATRKTFYIVNEGDNLIGPYWIARAGSIKGLAENPSSEALVDPGKDRFRTREIFLNSGRGIHCYPVSGDEIREFTRTLVEYQDGIYKPPRQ